MAGEIVVGYEGKLRCAATCTRSEEVVHTDVGADHGGLGQYFSPVELVVASLGACVASMMGVVAERNDVDLTGMRVQADMTMASSPSRRLGSITLTVTIPGGEAISEVVRNKLQAAASACPVKNSLHPDVEVHMEFIYQ